MLEAPFLELCTKVISIDSSPKAGNWELASFLAQLCRDQGMHVTLQDAIVDGIRQANLIARPAAHRPSTEVLFQTHLDTVEPGPMSRWTETNANPFAATVKNGKIFGLGTADVKIDFLCKLWALKGLVGTKLRTPFVLVGTYLEEVAMDGVRHLLKSKAVNAQMAVVGEPSELNIVYGNNGYGDMRFFIPFEDGDHRSASKRSAITEFTGKAVHSSTPDLGDNAIHKLIEHLRHLSPNEGVASLEGGSQPNVVPALATLESSSVPSCRLAAQKLVFLTDEIRRFAKEVRQRRHADFSPPYSTFNIAMLSTIETGFELTVSFRVVPVIDLTEINRWMDHFKGFAQSLGGRFRLVDLTPAGMARRDSPLIRGAVAVATQLGLPAIPITKAATTEASHYCQNQIDAIVFGPGVSKGNSHTANEHNDLGQIEKAIVFYRHLAERLCL